ncbi:MAG: D-alanine--D-alanine ligase [Puniceicoccales bacterium]|jgi:D-alanine-D-alanine ligase|nr:D-alanine--D-alanine ligase [Puniceicoccales bacterium]
MEKSKKIILLCGGGSSSEREISLLSGENVYAACAATFPIKNVILESDALPKFVCDSTDSVIFPVTHGEFGEDGALQRILESHGLAFVGSDSVASALCMDKFSAKRRVASAGVPVVDGIKFTKSDMPTIGDVTKALGRDLFLKPNAKGSSIGARAIQTVEDLKMATFQLSGNDEYILEQRVRGIDLTVSILDGAALEVVEILPNDGFLDYWNKYTPGNSRVLCPAEIPNDVRAAAKNYAEIAFRACGCRDWARVDFILRDDGKIFFLEINTIPGMTKTSFYPLAAKISGIGTELLVAKLVELACARRDNAA